MNSYDLIMKMVKETTKAVETITEQTQSLNSKIALKRKEKFRNMVTVVRKWGEILTDWDYTHVPIIDIPCLDDTRVGISYDKEKDVIYFHSYAKNKYPKVAMWIRCTDDINKAYDDERVSVTSWVRLNTVLDYWDGRIYEKKFAKEIVQITTLKLDTANGKYMDAMNTAKLLKIA